MRLLSIVDARPQFIRCAPLSYKLQNEHEKDGVNLVRDAMKDALEYNKNMTEKKSRVTQSNILGSGNASKKILNISRNS